MKQQNEKSISPRQEKIEKICCGLTHSGCVMGGKAYVWGMMGVREQLVFKQPTQIQIDYSDTGSFLR